MTSNYPNINATDLRDYAKSLGWQLLPEAVKKKMFVMSNPRYDRRQLIFPLESSAGDYGDAIEIAINKLSEIENKPPSLIISEIQELKEDTLRFRIFDTRNSDNYIPFSYAVSAINGAKELFVAAACTVLKPQSHHPRMNRAEALDLIDKSRFRHTEQGSFILKVSSPLNALDITANTFGDGTMPFVRQTTLTINKSLSDLVIAIQTDTLDVLVDEIKQSPNPLISSNFCKALTNFKEEYDEFNLSINFKWSDSLSIPSGMYLPEKIEIQKDYFSRIDEVRIELRNTERQTEDVYMATVERLDGNLNDGMHRSGEVILNLLQEDETIRVRTNLNETNYADADMAHMTAGAYIRIKGKLHPGNQPKLFTDVSLFELIMP